MKKIISLLLLLSISIFAFASCGEEPDDTKIRIGYMQGPTGMGMAKLIHDNGGLEAGNEKYSFNKYTDTTNALKDLTKGEIDVICVPTNEAVVFYNTTDDNTVVLAINTLGSLFLATDANTTISSFEELDGKTIYTCKNGTPKKVLEYLIGVYKINATISTSADGKELTTPTDLGKALKDGIVDIAVVPEPILTSSTLNNEHNYSVDLKLNDVWNDKCETELTMGCIVANKTFVNEHKGVINNFLKEYKASIEYVNAPENLETAANYVVETGVMGAVPAAKSALKNLNGAIVYIDGKDMKDALEAFYKAIGIPGASKNAFYYEK